MTNTTPPIAEVEGTRHYRIIPSAYPPVNFFERLVDPSLWEALFALESLTNDRLRDEVGDISRVPAEDRVTGTGATVVMAAFTHVGLPSRFSPGDYGVYYAGLDLDTAIAESKHSRARWLSYTHEGPLEIDLRVYLGEVAKPLHDIRAGFDHYHQPDNWLPSQAFGGSLRETRSWGILYRSVRHPGGECIAALRPPAITLPRQTKHLSYVWDGEVICGVYEKKLIST
ncbi:MAG: RES family NAD+ phosphorylase [Gammaproteobacteria bacterium]|nr:RES family NAD+ phosphorylase [Gammaproteobacteria bacterium]